MDEKKAEQISKFVETSKHAGKVTLHDIYTFFIKNGMDIEDFDPLYTALIDNGVLIDDIPDVPFDEDLSDSADADSLQLPNDDLALLFPTLTRRELIVIRLLFGLDDGHPRMIEDIASEFNETSENISRIVLNALSKLFKKG